MSEVEYDRDSACECGKIEELDIHNDFEYTLTARALRQIKAEAWWEGVYAHRDHTNGWPYPQNPHEKEEAR